MKAFVALLVGTSLCLSVDAQLNVSLLGHLDYQALRNSNLSNLWGYVDEFGNEYALEGVNGDDNVPNSGGLSIVDITDPANPNEVFFTPGPNSIWREIKVWNDHAYVTTEANAGLLIVDLSPLPQSNVLPTVLWTDGSWETSHSLFIDENGRLYLNGANRGAGGVIMYDLTVDPMDPVEVGEFQFWYVHDCFARGDTLYAAHISDGFFSIVDVSDPSAPVLLGTQNTPSDFTHNVWLDDSGDHLFTTDERSGAWVGSYDVSDPSDIQFQDKLQSDPGSGTIPHNTYWLNDFVVTSYYTYGVSIYDASHPDNLVEVGNYDTSPLSGDGFFGAWGVYPFLPSGNLIVSDIEQGLFILGPNYVAACLLEGDVTDANTSAPINGAHVTILGPSVLDSTNFSGHYTTGHHTAGTYDVLFEASGYGAYVATGVVLVSGQVTQLDVALDAQFPFSYSGEVVDAVTLQGVPSARVRFHGTFTDYDLICDASGAFSIPLMEPAYYEVSAGQWGWHTNCSMSGAFSSSSLALTIPLDPGYYDDFIFDFGWIDGGNASTGDWERGEPVGTSSNGAASNPDFDVATDCGGQAYVTGNGGGNAGDDDVDAGYVQLTSPLFDVSADVDPHVRYQRWFFNGGGMGSPNDSLTISLSNGLVTVPIEVVTATSPDNSSWVENMVRISDHLPPTANMRLIARAADSGSGHLVEGAIDLFEVLPNPFTSVPSEHASLGLHVWPLPNDGDFMVSLDEGQDATAELLDVQGRRVFEPRALVEGQLAFRTDLPSGLYVLHVCRGGVPVASVRVPIQ